MTLCRTQAEVDAAVNAGRTVELDDSWTGNAHAVLRGNARAVLRGNARAVLRGNAHAVLWGNARAVLRDNAHAVLWDNAHAVLWDNAHAVLWDNAHADLWDNAHAVLRDNAHAVLRGWLTSARLIGPNATASGSGRWLRVDTPAAWAKYHGLRVTKGTVALYKAVAADGTGGHGYTPIVYEPGTTAEAPDWDPSHLECGGGLHLCATPQQAREHGRDVARVLACRVHLDDIAVYEPNLDKVRCRRVEVLHEVAE